MKRISALAEILPYVTEFHGQIFVIKVGGEVCTGVFLDEITRQISLLHHMGIKVVLVHGGGPQMEELQKRLGIEVKVIGGRRITDDATLEVAKMLFAGLISTDLVAKLREHGASAVGLTGVDAGLVSATRRPPKQVTDDDGKLHTVDFGHVGDIRDIDPKIIDLLLGQGIVPVISSLGGDSTGQVFNINADTIAAKVAAKLNARKLIVLSNVPGVLRDKNDITSLISYTDVESLEDLLKSGSVMGGMRPKVEACIESVRSGVHRTHIIDGTKPGSMLVELFLNEGCGTMIVDKKEKVNYEMQVSA